MNAEDRPEPIDVHASAARRTVLDLPRELGQVDYFRSAVAERVRRRRWRRIQLTGACAALVLVGVSWYTATPRQAIPLVPAGTSAVVSLPPRQTLPDGSTVELKDDAAITVAFDAAIRRVVLVKGEAHFQVATNPDRPFVVQARGVDIRAVGTAFSVQLRTAEVEVLVTEGRVAVDTPSVAGPAASAPSDASTTLASVPAGNRVVVGLATQPESLLVVVPVTVAEAAERLAWRVPRLEFSGTPLTEAMAIVSRYSGLQLALGDPELAKVEVSGVLRADNIDSLLRMLELNYSIAAHRSGDSITLLRAR